MKIFFDDNDKIRILKNELDSWLGTPWRHRCQSRNGCDCIGFVYSVMVNLGVLDKNITTIPEYQRDWHIHKTTDLLLNTLCNIPSFCEVGKNKKMSGDILLFKYGRVSAHVGIVFEKHIYHSPTNLRVIKSPLNDRMFFKRLKHNFRPVEV